MTIREQFGYWEIEPNKLKKETVSKYKGDLKGFPEEIVEKMLEEQVKQGSRRDVSVFENEIKSDIDAGGFIWEYAKDGHTFWSMVITCKDFNTFFEKYPKQKPFSKADLKTGMLAQTRDGDVGLVLDDCIIFPDYYVKVSDLNEDLTNKIFQGADVVRVSKKLKIGFKIPKYWTEEVLNKNLLWKREETIKIEGKRYNKKEAMKALSVLKTI